MARLEELVATASKVVGPDAASRLHFVAELDRLRLVERRSYVGGGVRREDAASHSWHLAVMALVFGDFLGDDIDLDHVVRMLLVHDIVEIDAGDVSVYEAEASKRAEAEHLAARRLYGLLPDAVGNCLWRLWLEFEAGETPEARAAAALDRLAPLVLNWLSKGATWREHGTHAGQVRALQQRATANHPGLRSLTEVIIDDAIRRGWLPEAPG